MYERIITHTDFDGVVSAAICSYALDVNFIVFTSPRTISDARMSITDKDVVCDLPCPMQVGLWFDHHEGNLEELDYRKIDTTSIPGHFAPEDSCARVVYTYFDSLPFHFKAMVEEADIIDAFKYANIQEWRQETPGSIVNKTIQLKTESIDQKWQYLRQLVAHLKSNSLDKVAQMPGVKKRYQTYLSEEQQILEQIKKDIVFLPKDKNKKIVIIDLTKHKRKPYIIKNLALLLYPQAQAIIEIRNIFKRDIKTNDLSISMSLSINLNNMQNDKHIGDIMRELNIGGGHPGAGAGRIYCDSKQDMLKAKDNLLNEIYDMFINQ